MLSVSDIYQSARSCKRCNLKESTTHVNFGVGNKKAPIMIIGEAPDNEADQKGQPIVGEAGILLNKILNASHIKKEDVYLTNVVKCNPPRDRNPQVDEIIACRPWLDLEIAAVQPDYIICLGLTASRTILGVNDSLKALRGKWHQFGEIKVLCTYQPKTLLKAPKFKVYVWQDFQLLMKELGIA